MYQNIRITVILSSCVIQTDVLQNCDIFGEDAHSLKLELNSEIKEPDARLIPHVKNVVIGVSTKIVALSTDVLVLFENLNPFQFKP